MPASLRATGTTRSVALGFGRIPVTRTSRRSAGTGGGAGTPLPGVALCDLYLFFRHLGTETLERFGKFAIQLRQGTTGPAAATAGTARVGALATASAHRPLTAAAPGRAAAGVTGHTRNTLPTGIRSGPAVCPGPRASGAALSALALLCALLCALADTLSGLLARLRALTASAVLALTRDAFGGLGAGALPGLLTRGLAGLLAGLSALSRALFRTLGLVVTLVLACAGLTRRLAA